MINLIFPKKSIPNFQNDCLTKALSQISCHKHTSAVSRRHAVLTIRASVGAASKVRAYYYKGTVEALESIS